MVNPWGWSDIEGVAIFSGLLTLMGLYMAGISYTNLWHFFRGRQRLSARDLLITALVIPFTLGAAWNTYSAVHKKHLLRGECRYTVAQVYENRRIKGAKVSRYTYQVQGKRYEDQQEVDWLGGWRPLGSRWYVRFAVPDPDIHEHPDRPVPDSVTQVPPAGWDSLPPAR